MRLMMIAKQADSPVLSCQSHRRRGHRPTRLAFLAEKAISVQTYRVISIDRQLRRTISFEAHGELTGRGNSNRFLQVRHRLQGRCHVTSIRERQPWR